LSARTGTPARINLSLVMVVLLAGVAAPVSGQQPTEPQVKTHVVKKGDTLWGLAGFYFTNPLLWPTIFEANRDVVEDPHWIYPKEVLRIPDVESGLPVVVRSEEPSSAGPQEQPYSPSESVRPVAHTRFWTEPPPVDSRREDDLALTRLPPYPVSPSEYWSAAWLEDATALGIRGKLLSLADPVSQKDKLPQYLHPFDEVLFGWLRGGELVLGDSMMVVSVGKAVGTFGQLIQPVALVRIDSIGENVASAVVLRQYGRARVGDLLITAAELPRFERVRPVVVTDGVEGRLIGWLEREPLYGTLDDGFIDLGAEDGLTVGDEFVAYVPARPGPGNTMALPAEPVARVHVIKVMPNNATVRVMDASSTALQAGVRVQLVRKIPAN